MFETINKIYIFIKGDASILILPKQIIFPFESSLNVMVLPSHILNNEIIDDSHHMPRVTAIKIPLFLTLRGLDAYPHQQI